VTAMVALDWGTSSLRAARLGSAGEVLEERATEHGILNVPPQGFPRVFDEVLDGWTLEPGTLCLASGMVGSRQGWVEAPYHRCPAGLPELAHHVAWVPDAPRGLRLGIAPGVWQEAHGVPDVMRGEEVQVVGAADLLNLDDGLFVLPGTHSKWVELRGRRIVDFATYMTGETYAVLRRHSILGRTMPGEDGALDGTAFLKGVLNAVRGESLLRSAFSARTFALFSRIPPEGLPSYLSGVVIGEELRAQRLENRQVHLVLVGSPALTHRYQLALRALGVQATAVGSEATWRGLWVLANRLGASE